MDSFSDSITIPIVKFALGYIIIFKLLSHSTIELLPQILDKLSTCCIEPGLDTFFSRNFEFLKKTSKAQSQLGDDQQACIFKKFEKMYYEQVLMRKSLDMIGKFTGGLALHTHTLLQTRKKKTTRK